MFLKTKGLSISQFDYLFLSVCSMSYSVTTAKFDGDCSIFSCFSFDCYAFSACLPLLSFFVCFLFYTYLSFSETNPLHRKLKFDGTAASTNTCTVDLQWFEDRLLVYHGYFELVLEYL